MTTYEYNETETKRPTALNLVSRAFWLGFISHILINLMLQDFHGLEGYKKLLDNHWVEISWGWWLIPLFIVTVLYYRVQKKTEIFS